MKLEMEPIAGEAALLAYEAPRLRELDAVSLAMGDGLNPYEADRSGGEILVGADGDDGAENDVIFLED